MIKEIEDPQLLSFLNIVKTSNPYTKYFTYMKSNNIMGYLVINHIYERIEIINIFVIESERNKKIGSQLLEYLINYAKKNNCINITLEVRIDNEYAIKLYEKYNFINVATRENYYNNIDGILMELIL